jgi:hypothetical protein
MRIRWILALAGLLAVTATPARADLLTVSIAHLANANLRSTYTNGSFYPVAPTTLTVGDVPFELTPLGMIPNSLGVIQTPDGNSEFTITTNIIAATSVYTLINSGFGRLGANNGRLEFVGSGGAFASFDLIQGVNIRDHLNGVFNNVVNDPRIVTENFGGNVRLDRQTFDLPASFASQTLTQIRFIGTNAGNPQGAPFLAGLTVQAVPEPSPMISAPLAGLIALGVSRLRSGRRA